MKDYSLPSWTKHSISWLKLSLEKQCRVILPVSRQCFTVITRKNRGRIKPYKLKHVVPETCADDCSNEVRIAELEERAEIENTNAVHTRSDKSGSDNETATTSAESTTSISWTKVRIGRSYSFKDILQFICTSSQSKITTQYTELRSRNPVPLANTLERRER
jgi:hypothetical protein